MKCRYWRIAKIKTIGYGDEWHGRISALTLRFNTVDGISSTNNTGFGISHSNYPGEPISNLYDDNNKTTYHPSDANKDKASDFDSDYAGFVFHIPQLVKDISVEFRSDTDFFKWTEAKIEYSLDGEEWQHFGYCYFDVSLPYKVLHTANIKKDYMVSGKSLQSDGLPCAYVLIHDYSTGNILDKIVPNADGSWEAFFSSDMGILLTHVGIDGYRPISDGPVIPKKI